mgnify:CR=1 FL=1
MGVEQIQKEELLELIQSAVKSAVEAHPLSQEEIQWVRMAIKAEADRAALRKAIIEKTLAGLVWTGLCAVGLYFVDWFSAHWISGSK